MSDLVITYPIDQAAALRAGRMCPDHAPVALTPETMALCTEADRAFLAHQVHNGEIALYVVRGTYHPLPKADRVLVPGQDLAVHLWACSQTFRVHAAEAAAQEAEHRARREQQEATERREQAALAAALEDLSMDEVMGDLPLSRLIGNGAAEYEARWALRQALVAREASLGYAWDHHGHEPPARAAVAKLVEIIGAVRERRKGARAEWVAQVVGLWGRPVDRERHAAGVIPRADVAALVWGAVHAPEGAGEPWECPDCGEVLEEARCTAEKSGPVSAAVWEAAQAIANAFDAGALEALGLCMNREIVVAEYDCAACEHPRRHELCVTMQHPHNGWTAPARYYPLVEGRPITEMRGQGSADWKQIHAIARGIR